MIQVKNLELQFGEQIIFDKISCIINNNDRIGLVGRNGTGKSTLLKIIGNHLQADGGTIDIQSKARIAYMPQEVVIVSTKTVLDETLATFDYLFALEEEKKELALTIHANPTEKQVNRYAEIEHELQEQNFAEKKVQAQKILAGLGFNNTKQLSKVSELSVGWRMRVVLAKLLLQEADFYLFDEPTNHLDLPTKNWFLHFLQNNVRGYLLVCHDRYFLDKACNTTYELSLGKLTIFQGNYSFYKKQKSFMLEHQQLAYKKQQQDIKQKERTIERFRSKATKAKMAQSMIKALEKVERIQIEDVQKTITLKLEEPKRSGYEVVTIKNVSHAFNTTLFKHVTFTIERQDKVAIVAPNGTGKTTLFNLIAQKLPLQHGTIQLGHNVKAALFDQDQEKILDPHKTIFQEVYQASEATDLQVRSVLGALLFGQDDINKLCSVLSGGERNRVAMAKVILSKANFLLLDEPTNHLDIESKEIILQALQQFEGTILFVSHDQDFVNKLATKIIELTPQGSYVYLGNYDSYLDAKQAVAKETVTEQKQQKSNSNNSQQSFDLQKKCKNLENKIDKLEQDLADILKQLETATYGTPEFEKLEHTYKSLQKTISQETSKWEDLLIQLDEGI
ncbi:MAG: hypothetical protein CL947_04085 [Epsilonproteobacteria bacterium]|nr:hypothetical protein [Campylobacterota bacterium]|tara:strand:- start:2767 stop:4626 length:1860 start_codon:yes stop_codon:yes gene_type:complete